MSNLPAQHECFEAVAQEIADSNGSKRVTLEMFIDKDACCTMKWLRLVAVKNVPICIVDDQDVKDSRMVKTNEFMEDEVRKGMKDKRILLIVDGGTEGKEHYLCVYNKTEAPDVFFLPFFLPI
ncbi:hypothetical protein PsorP6_016609 [Peronosclerospora sorghi]|uniref:Uncharacterized protein n=1 Tax=Peronosclerospora sorghi TaxID=230839 RepID=A0ACC0VRZ0_9STRA|nr:hypothetical protein PsorP6_016609 [Peronosclerospora sorghi]